MFLRLFILVLSSVWGGPDVGLFPDPQELVDARWNAVLHPLGDEAAIVSSPIPMQRVFQMLHAVEVPSDADEVATAASHWRRRVLSLGGKHRWGPPLPNFAEIGRLLAAVVEDEGGFSLELFDPRSGHTQTTAPLPQLTADYEAVGDAWGALITTLGELLVIAYPALAGGGPTLRVMGFNTTLDGPDAHDKMHLVFNFDVPMSRAPLRHLVVTECQILIVPSHGEDDVSTAWPRPDRDCSAQHPSSRTSSQSTTTFGLTVLEQTAAHAVVEYEYWNSTTRRASHKELWLFEPTRSTMLSRTQSDCQGAGSKASFQPLNPGIPTSAYLTPTGVWVDRWSLVPRGTIAPGIVPAVLQGDWYGVRTLALAPLPPGPMRAQSVVKLTIVGLGEAEEPAAAFGVGNHLVTRDHAEGLRFNFYGDPGVPTSATFDPIAKPYMDDFRVGPRAGDNPRLFVAPRAGRYFRVGTSPAATAELRPPEGFNAALADSGQRGVFPGPNSLWAVGPAGVVRWRVPGADAQ